MTVITSLSNSSANSSLEFYLYNIKTNTKTKLSATKIVTTQADMQRLTATTDVAYSVAIPEGTNLKDSMLLTSVNGAHNSSTYYNAKSVWDFILYDYVNDPLQGLKYVGLSFTILISIYAIVSKLKGHFLA